MAFAVNSLYRVTQANLDPLQLVLVGTVLEAAVFLFELPTGIVADLYSRRLSVITGVFLVGAGFLLEGSLPSFLPILLAQALWGIGYTFTSGALQAWISDEIGEERAGPAFLRAAQLSQLGALAGMLAGSALGIIRVNLPILVSGGLFWGLGLFLIFAMPERGFRPATSQQRAPWRDMARTMQSGLQIVRCRPALATLLAIGVFLGMYTEGFDRLWIAHLLEQFTFTGPPEVIWFGLIQAVSMLLAAGATGLARRSLDPSDPQQMARFLATVSAALVVLLLAFAAAGSLWLAIGLYWLVMALREVTQPVYTAWVNQRLDSQVRATVLSMSSQMDAFGQIAGGPLIGLVARQVSLRAGLFGSALLLSPVLLLFARLKLRRASPA